MTQFMIATTAALALAAGLSAQVQKTDVDIKAADGINLKATYFSPVQAGPAVLLLHQCNMDRHSWDGLAKDLADAGFHVLAIDFRGHGESAGSAERAEQSKWPGDIDVAYAYLTSQKGVTKSRTAVAGAACTVGPSLDLANRNQEVKAVVLLSSGANEAEKTYISGTPTLALFGAAAEADGNAAKATKEAVEASKNPQSAAKIYPGNEHGVPMFGKNAALEPEIVSWVKAQLLVK